MRGLVHEDPAPIRPPFYSCGMLVPLSNFSLDGHSSNSEVGGEVQISLLVPCVKEPQGKRHGLEILCVNRAYVVAKVSTNFAPSLEGS